MFLVHRGQMQLFLPPHLTARDSSTGVEAVILPSGCSIIHAKTLSQAYGGRLVIVLPRSALSRLSLLCSALSVLLNPYISWGFCCRFRGHVYELSV